MSILNTINMPPLTGNQAYTQISSDGVNVWTAQAAGTAIFKIPYNNPLNPITVLQDGDWVIGGLSSDGTNLWVSYTSYTNFSQHLLQIDMNGNIITTINFGVNQNNVPISVSSDGTNVWVVFIGINSFVHQINCSTLSISPEIPTGTYSAGISSDGTNVWVANEGSNSITQIDCNSGTVVNTISTINNLAPIAVSSDGQNVWVTNNNQSSSFGYFVINCSSGSIVHSVTGNNYILISGISIYGNYVYISNYYEIIILDATTFANITSISVSDSESIYYDGQFAWVTNLNTQVYQISTPGVNYSKEITRGIYTTNFYSQYTNQDLGSIFSSYTTPLTSPSFYNKFYCYIGGTQYELSQLFVRHSTPLSISPLNTGFFQIINNIVYDLSQIYVIYPFTQVISNPNLYFYTFNNYFYILFPENTTLNSQGSYGPYTINTASNFSVSGYIIAGGGGGAPGSTNTTDTKGGGGGGGGETVYINTTVIASNTFSITLGGGGSGATVGNFGTALSGQNSLLYINSNIFLTAYGGQGARGGITAGDGGQVGVNGGTTTEGDGNPGTNGGGGAGGKGYDLGGLSTGDAGGGGGGGVAEGIQSPFNFINTNYGGGGINPVLLGRGGDGGDYGGGAGAGGSNIRNGLSGHNGGGGGGGASQTAFGFAAGAGGPGGGGWALIVLIPT